MMEPWYLLSDDGKKSLSYSLVIYSFCLICLWVIAFVIGCSLQIPVPFDSTFAVAFLSACMATYSFRKHDKKKKRDAEEQEK
jgi:positive regulator of sigma E activity